jgi:beta-carotene ketolase (CrtW type)
MMSTTLTTAQAMIPYSKNLGIVWAIVIISLWSFSFVGFLLTDLTQFSTISCIAIVLSRTFLQTGLFILAHDAMHQSLVPGNVELNHAIGKFAIGLYALLNYDQCLRNHQRHHQIPGQVGDPDFHDGSNPQGLSWYFQFLRTYLPLSQMLVFVTVVGIGLVGSILVLQVSVVNFALVWMAPLILSSLQLFCFGTYLPHRHEDNLIRSAYYPKVISLLVCYHFSYHQEHHSYPNIPWYALPDCKI